MAVQLTKLSPWKYMLEKTGEMRVPGIVYASERLISDFDREESLKQVMNVACLPGIQTASIAMPDIHWGYGFPIGGVAAMAMDGVVSPGGVGYDINCGVRLMSTGLHFKDIEYRLDGIVNELYNRVPSGIGSSGDVVLDRKELKEVMRKGARWAVENGYGDSRDLERIEENGCITAADPSEVSERSIERGRDQLGTVGSGNHFAEIGRVEEIFDSELAEQLGLHPGQVTIFLHSGSRGFGHQICDDYLSRLNREFDKTGISIPDRQLVCAPIVSATGRSYLAAMACAANFAWANRQILSSRIEDALMKHLGLSPRELDAKLIYDVSHNIAKFEDHDVAGKRMKLLVHRKGATRALPKGNPLLTAYRDIGQPVLVPGDMGRSSFILVAQDGAKETFCSCCHGAGRLLSRHQAIKKFRGRKISDELAKKGIYVKAASGKTLMEEAPETYKDVNLVVDVVHDAGIAKKAVRIVPLAVLKG